MNGIPVGLYYLDAFHDRHEQYQEIVSKKMWSKIKLLYFFIKNISDTKYYTIKKRICAINYCRVYPGFRIRGKNTLLNCSCLFGWDTGPSDAGKVWLGERVPKLPLDIQKSGRRKLRTLNSSQNIADLRIPPSNRLAKLAGG